MNATSIERRAVLRRACLYCCGITGLLAGTGARAQATTTGPVVEVPPEGERKQWARLQRPALDTDEGGLWAMMDREETRLRRSPFLVKDAGLSDYLRGIVCRLVGDQCADIRVHLLRTPLFNASMAPNGMMQVWTGLLLRVENEAQLAAIIGHELGHYLERHTLEQLRDFKSRAAFAQFLGLFGLVGAVGQLGVLAGAFAFSREHENRADRIGMQLMQRAGYDASQAAQVWDNLLVELKVTGGENAGRRSPMFATHPPVENRSAELLRLAGEATGESRAGEFHAAIAAHRLMWLGDEIRRGQHEESLALLDRLIRLSPADSQLRFARGEVYRLRSGADDLQRAVDDLAGAVQLQDPPATAFRSLGLVQKQRSDMVAASGSFQKYLAAAPDAADTELIKTYIKDIAP